jgi:hypothetical protein
MRFHFDLDKSRILNALRLATISLRIYVPPEPEPQG